MKSYLSLIPISAKVSKRKNRKTLLCIIFAVFLVTSIFSMADMGVRMERARLISKHGTQAVKDISTSMAAQTLYTTAAVLFILILISGVLMIASSINTNVLQRTKFFGMMRCIGMSQKQIIHFVKLEALYWCKTAVPIGVLLGIAMTWVLCAVLKFWVGGEFIEIPLWGISFVGIISGIVMGLTTVLIAASAPAKRAIKVSPIAAVSGYPETHKNQLKAVQSHFFKIETALGMQHAVAEKKNLILMISSFALSIILFLSFSVLIETVGHVMPQSASTSDISILSRDEGNSIEASLKDKIDSLPSVNQVFGRRSLLDIAAKIGGKADKIDMICYDRYDLECLIKDKQLKSGSDLSKVYGNSHGVLAIVGENTDLKIGDSLKVGSQSLEIAGQLKTNPFSQDGMPDDKITIITSGETFRRITGITDYALIMIQTAKNFSDSDLETLQKAVGDQYIFKDLRDQSTASTYIAFMFLVYGFLAMIALVTLLNIMNSMSMSVSARLNQYGAMRAVGMDEYQMIKMIAAEALTYSISGCIVGLTAGLALNKLLYDRLITTHFAYATWSIPIEAILVIGLVILLATFAAIYAPAKKIQQMAVTEVINEL